MCVTVFASFTYLLRNCGGETDFFQYQAGAGRLAGRA